MGDANAFCDSYLLFCFVPPSLMAPNQTAAASAEHEQEVIIAQTHLTHVTDMEEHHSNMLRTKVSTKLQEISRNMEELSRSFK